MDMFQKKIRLKSVCEQWTQGETETKSNLGVNNKEEFKEQYI